MKVQNLHDAFALFADGGDYEVYLDWDSISVAARDIAPDSDMGQRLQKLGWDHDENSREWILRD